MNDRRVEVLHAATRRRRENAEKAVQKAIREAHKTSAPITITAIAAAARVSTDFIYRHLVLRPQVEALRRSRRTAGPEPADHPDAEAAESTLVRRLTQQLATERRKHREEAAELRAALEAAHGELLILRRRAEEQG
ncbi:DUF6262 family protein [Actinoallomurus iriomotensis]|uniref:Transposase n=1 Tax=Actinoallomurus iriomotensis TaxID=478107 RepID=A0A9W6S2Q3_9ACTN|nr:DUF6262 family protein [Actinoallomurus iriomotensis]GLY86083.1 hypothetical protein Airi02_040120 [Actinoallomurus iriomotensis]